MHQWVNMEMEMMGDFLTIIIIIKKGRQCKDDTEWCTPYQWKTAAPQYQTMDRKKRKGKIVEDYSRDRAA